MILHNNDQILYKVVNDNNILLSNVTKNIAEAFILTLPTDKGTYCKIVPICEGNKEILLG